MCVVCRSTSDKRTLLRVVRLSEKRGGGVVADPGGKLPGRGAYVCASPKCIERAIKERRIKRSLSVDEIPATLIDDLLALCAPLKEDSGADEAMSTGAAAL
jgi:hypothetical protein